MKGISRKVPGLPLINGRKDRDEDLLLFKELHKREKDRLACLLQPVSDEFEPNIGGNYALYRIASGSRKGSGHEFFGENDKNDYDWLKTPPATPLFPSLEMEANAPEHVVQREIPIIFQPLSRFADNSEALKGSTVTLKTTNSKPNKIPQRSVTPSQKQRISSSTENKNSKVAAQFLNQKMAQFTTNSNKKTNVIANSTKPTNPKESQTNFLSSNISKDIKTKPANRGVSPSVRSTIPAQIPGFSNETPPNLRTDRATSATRGRPAAANPTASVHQKQDPSTPRPRRQSCSPSVTRGRKESNEGNLISTPKGKTVTGNNGAQIFGSRMVDKVMNARKLGAEEREGGKPKQQSATKSANSSANASPSPSHGFGKMMMTKSQMDMAFKHMEITRDRINSRHLGITSGRRSSGRN